jgi:hypothetical protein
MGVTYPIFKNIESPEIEIKTSNRKHLSRKIRGIFTNNRQDSCLFLGIITVGIEYNAILCCFCGYSDTYLSLSHGHAGVGV